MRIGLVAGESSGDQLGASLIRAIQSKYPHANFEGVAGPKMQAAGCKSLFDIERLSVMGLWEPLKRLPDLIKLRRDLKQHFLKNPPDIFIGIDAPDFNLGLERLLHDKGIKTVHYVSPSVWAWRRYRVRKIAKSVDLMMTLFPFEADFYKRRKVPVAFVGHPLADSIPQQIDITKARQSLGLDGDKVYVALLPGSRRQELTFHAETYIKAAKQLHQQFPNIEFISPQINQKHLQYFKTVLAEVAPELPIKLFLGRSHEVMAASDYLIVTSGTATFEAMLYKKPMVIAYRMPAWMHKLATWLVKIPYVGLPNIIYGDELVPELIQDEATPAAIAQHLAEYISDSQKSAALTKEFQKIHESLSCDSSGRALDAISSLLNK